MNAATAAMLLKIAKPVGKAALEAYRKHLNRKYKKVLRRKIELERKKLEVRRLTEADGGSAKESGADDEN